MFEEYYNAETKTLRFTHDFDEELKDLPTDTQIIIFEENFNKGEYSKFNQIVDNLPNNLIHLTFGYCFYQSVDKLPDSLTHLSFGCYFNKSADNLPKNLTHLTFESDAQFNQSVDKLPKKLTHLTFGKWFDQSVNKLPKNLTHLTFGKWFNQSVNKLPTSLTHLTFGYCFGKSVHILPKSIIELGFYSHHKIKNDIPESVENINIYFHSMVEKNETIENILPTIKQIKVNDKNKLYLIKKIPFGCKLVDEKDREIFL